MLNLTDEFSLNIKNLYFTETKPDTLIQRWNNVKLFHKLILVQKLAPQMCLLALGSFIQETLGKRFTDVANNSSLPSLYAFKTKSKHSL